MARKGLSVDDSLRRGRCRSQVGPTGAGTFCGVQKKQTLVRLYQFFGGFFFVAFPSGNILNHLQNKKQVKKKHKTNPITPMRFVCLFCFVLFCFVLFCFVCLFVQGDSFTDSTTILKSPFFITHWLNHLPPLEICFLKPNRCHPVSALRFGLVFLNEILRLQRCRGIQPLHLTFLRLR